MKRRHVLWLTALVVLALAVTAGIIFYFPKADAKEDTVRVPLGVEQAAIVTYSGPLLAVAPYKWGVAVNVRIAEVTTLPDRRIYDLRYIVNRAGTFDLKDYLLAEDGGSLAGLPTFEFTGDPKLSKNLDARIQETEEIRIDVGGRYYELLAVLTVLWLVWLLLLIFYKRPRPPAAEAAAPSGPTVPELMRGFLARLEAGSLDTAAKARMEMTLLQCWRRDLELADQPMTDVLDHIRRSEKTREPLRKLQHWLHHPASPVGNAEIAALLRPYTAEVPA